MKTSIVLIDKNGKGIGVNGTAKRKYDNYYEIKFFYENKSLEVFNLTNAVLRFGGEGDCLITHSQKFNSKIFPDETLEINWSVNFIENKKGAEAPLI